MIGGSDAPLVTRSNGRDGLAAPVTPANLRAAPDRGEAAGGTVADLQGMLVDAGANGAGTDIIGR